VIESFVVLALAALLGAGEWSAPQPGSYELPPIQSVREWSLVDPEGQGSPLPGLAEGQVALVSFVYRGCHQTSGCPLALAALQKVDRALAADAAFGARVRLATVSFDPSADTPQRMGELRRMFAPRSDWRFLTARDSAGIDPVLDDYGQDAVRLLDPHGSPTALIRHVLKVFLIDWRGRVRNVYSAEFLRPELLLADARTVLLEAGEP
jgi:cytochrome oxidase Cu insertion factor (SCO1/SenC/PrrC family)